MPQSAEVHAGWYPDAPKGMHAFAATKPKLLSKSMLKLRGWTEGLITKLLKHTDETKPNPRYKTRGAAMQLFQTKRVERIEKTKRFQDSSKTIKSMHETRSNAGRKAVATRTSGLITWIASLPDPDLPKLGIVALREHAVDHYNKIGGGSSNLMRERNEWKSTSYSGKTDPDAFLDRITVNYVRHQQTDYEFNLLRLKGKIGKLEAASAVRSKVLDTIAKAYPWLAAECENQKR